MARSASRSPRGLGPAKKAVFAAVTALGLLGLLEGAARLIEAALPIAPVDVGLGFDASSRLFLPSPEDPELLVTAPAKRASFQPQSFRRRKASGVYRIAVLGGSTVNFLEPELRVMRGRLRQALAARYSDVEIINAGGLSYGSDRLVRLAMELVSYDLDGLILYSGHNEFEEVEQLQLAELDTLPLQRMAAHLALVRLGQHWVARARVAQLSREHDKRILAAAPEPARAWRHPFTAEEATSRMNAFRRNGALVISEARKRGIAVIVGTIPSNLIRPYLPRASWEPYRQVGVLFQAARFDEARELARGILRQSIGRHQSSDLENGITRDLAQEHGVVLADVEAAIAAAEPHHIPGETLFVDHCHLNEVGNRIVREVFERSVLDLETSAR